MAGIALNRSIWPCLKKKICSGKKDLLNKIIIPFSFSCSLLVKVAAMVKYPVKEER